MEIVKNRTTQEEVNSLCQMQGEAEELLKWSGDPRNTGQFVADAQQEFADKYNIPLEMAVDYLEDLGEEIREGK